MPSVVFSALVSRPARGAWIEILSMDEAAHLVQRRAPHGARGLKSAERNGRGGQFRSRPARGAWIEIAVVSGQDMSEYVAPRTGRVD